MSIIYGFLASSASTTGKLEGGATTAKEACGKETHPETAPETTKFAKLEKGQKVGGKVELKNASGESASLSGQKIKKLKLWIYAESSEIKKTVEVVLNKAIFEGKTVETTTSYGWLKLEVEEAKFAEIKTKIGELEFYGMQGAGASGTRSIADLVMEFEVEAENLPVITKPSKQVTEKGQSVSFQVEATNSPTEYKAKELPAGLTLNESTGKITGSPTTAGTKTVTLEAKNANGSASPVTFEWEVTKAIPVITKPARQSTHKNEAVSLTITATNTPTKWGAKELPTGLSISETTGKITGTPTTEQTKTVTLEAENAEGKATNVTFEWEITAEATKTKLEVVLPAEVTAVSLKSRWEKVKVGTFEEKTEGYTYETADGEHVVFIPSGSLDGVRKA